MPVEVGGKSVASPKRVRRPELAEVLAGWVRPAELQEALVHLPIAASHGGFAPLAGELCLAGRTDAVGDQLQFQ